MATEAQDSEPEADPQPDGATDPHTEPQRPERGDSGGPDSGPDSVSEVLRRLAKGDSAANSELIKLLYTELHQLASRRMAAQPRDHTLQATALVNEAYVKLFDGAQASFRDRDHFLAVAATAMRSVLVDHARGRNRIKRKPKGERVFLEDVLHSYEQGGHDVIALDDALHSLAALDPQAVSIVDMRFFGGLTEEETARVLSLSVRTVQRDWAAAKAWLHKELSK